MAYTVTIDDIELTLESSPTLFSPDGPDRGTLAMLSTVHLNTDDKVLDRRPLGSQADRPRSGRIERCGSDRREYCQTKRGEQRLVPGFCYT